MSTSVSLPHQDLGRFLRAYRDRLRPAEVGLPDNPGARRRRAPGLRREEVAALAGIGVTWYSWLEQGRASVSRQVLDSVTQVLQLDEAARHHAFTLAGFSSTAPKVDSGETVAAHLEPVLQSWRTSPAVLLDQQFDLVAWNAAWAAVWPDPATMEPDERNLLWQVFTDPALRRVREWESFAKALLAQFRAHTAGDVEEQLGALEAELPHLRHWWQCRSIGAFTTQRLSVETGQAGEITVTASCLRPEERPDMLILVHTPVTDLDQQRVMRCLNVSTTAAHVS